MKYKIDGRQCSLQIDTAIYSIEIIYKCFYWFTGDFEIDITNNGANQCQVAMVSKTEDTNFNPLISRIKQNLIDFKLREIVNKETQTIRELIIAKAFANFEMEETIIGNVSDPVGFNPSLI